MSIAVIGSGAIGHALATRFAQSSVAVSIATRGEPSSLAQLARELSPYVVPTSVREGLRATVVILAVPFTAIRDLADVASGWSDRIVVDATNAIDLPTFSPTDLGGRPSTQVVAEILRAPRVVKAFNTLPAALLGTDPRVSDGRRVLFLSGDDAAANTEISALIEKLGFAPIDLGKLSDGGRLQQFGGPLAIRNLTQHPIPAPRREPTSPA
jgi:predicted dinucleotide-binding enzyme